MYNKFEDAYQDSGRAVGMTWARCRQKAELSTNTDAAHVLSLTATSAKNKACDEIKKKKKGSLQSSSKGGNETQPPEASRARNSSTYK